MIYQINCFSLNFQGDVLGQFSTTYITAYRWTLLTNQVTPEESWLNCVSVRGVRIKGLNKNASSAKI